MQQADNDPAANEVTDNVLSFHYKLRVFGAIGTTVAETDPLVVTPLPRLSDDEPSTPTSNAPEIRDIVVIDQTPLIEGEPILGLGDFAQSIVRDKRTLLIYGSNFPKDRQKPITIVAS